MVTLLRVGVWSHFTHLTGSLSVKRRVRLTIVTNTATCHDHTPHLTTYT
jgi:hypothetical protein